MINLIPSSAKRNVTTEYWIRVSSVGLLVLSGVFIATAILLSPAYVLVTEQIKIYADSAEEANAKVAEHDLSSAPLIQTGARAKLILDLKNIIPFTNLVELLQSLQSPSISIDSFKLNRGEDGLQPIEITGKALTRQALADFRGALLKEESIETAFLPISNLAQDKNITFSVTVTMKKET